MTLDDCTGNGMVEVVSHRAVVAAVLYGRSGS